MKKTLVFCTALLAPVIVISSTISLEGSTAFGGGGDFANYIKLSNGDAWEDSSKSEHGATLTVSQSGIHELTSVANWSETEHRGNGTEINFQLGDGPLRTADFGAVLGNHFISIQLKTEVMSTLDEISVKLWRNGAAAPETFQFAYANDWKFQNDSIEKARSTVSDTFLGTPVSREDSGVGNTFTVSATVDSDAGTIHEVRLYFWNGGDIQANTHLFEVRVDYTLNP